MRRNLILTDGGMGDLICQLVAVNYLLKTHTHVKFEVWVPDYLHKFAMHVLQFDKVFPFNQATKHFDSKVPSRTSQWLNFGHTPMRTHPVDYGFHALADMHMYDMPKKNYLQIRPDQIDISKFKLPSAYACIQVTFAEEVKRMKDETICAIFGKLRSQGLEVVFLGKNKAETGTGQTVNGYTGDYPASLGIDLVNQTDMLQSAAIIAGAKVYVGMDSGLTHLAGCTDTPIIAGYTLVDPKHVMPIKFSVIGGNTEAVTPPQDIPNRYFQTSNSFFEGDYRKFPGWEKVRDSLKTEDFLKLL